MVFYRFIDSWNGLGWMGSYVSHKNELNKEQEQSQPTNLKTKQTQARLSPLQFHLTVVKLTLLKITCTLQVVNAVTPSKALIHAALISVLWH